MAGVYFSIATKNDSLKMQLSLLCFADPKFRQIAFKKAEIRRVKVRSCKIQSASQRRY